MVMSRVTKQPNSKLSSAHQNGNCFIPHIEESHWRSSWRKGTFVPFCSLGVLGSIIGLLTSGWAILLVQIEKLRDRLYNSTQMTGSSKVGLHCSKSSLHWLFSFPTPPPKNPSPATKSHTVTCSLSLGGFSASSPSRGSVLSGSLIPRCH